MPPENSDASVTAPPGAPPTPPAAPPGPANPTVEVDAASLVSANIVPDAPPAPGPVTGAPAGETDARGTVFDPDRHRSGADGRPLRNSHGHFYSKLTGRPPKRGPDGRWQRMSNGAPAPGAAMPPPGADAGPAFASPPAGPGNPDQYDALAETFLQIWYGPAVLAFTEDFRTTSGEHLVLKTALANWLRVKQMEELPEGWAFALVAAGVYLPKFQKPTVRERLALYVMKAKVFFGRIFGRKRAPSSASREPGVGNEADIIDLVGETGEGV
jgi:hypothetical protein